MLRAFCVSPGVTVPQDLGLAVLLLALPACATQAGRVHEQPTVTHEGAGWALRVPAGARVDVKPGVLTVDAPDGRRWFDVTWRSAQETPEGIAYAWGSQHCTPMMWGQPSTPAPGVWIADGQCTIQDRRFWAFLIVERHEQGALTTTYVAEQRRMPYEDAWVDLLDTALSLRAGGSPLPRLENGDLRARIREAAAEHPGEQPLPGGGLLGGRVSERLIDVWQARLSAPPPLPLGH